MNMCQEHYLRPKMNLFHKNRTGHQLNKGNELTSNPKNPSRHFKTFNQFMDTEFISGQNDLIECISKKYM